MGTRKLSNVGVIGLGQIGGSIARSLSTCSDVVFYARSESVRELGRASGLTAVESLEELSGLAEIIFLAVPVDQTGSVLEELLPNLRPGHVLTDVGSTKMEITDTVNRLNLPSGVSFIGGHPMAGNTTSGFSGSSPGLFDNRSWVLTTELGSAIFDIDALISLIGIITGGLSANVMVLEPKVHDQLVASVSHLEHLIAIALVEMVRNSGKEKLAAVLAAGSFRDATRVAMSSAKMAVPFLVSNPFLRETVDEFTKCINGLSQGVSNQNAFAESWESARVWREKLESADAFTDEIELDYSDELVSQLVSLSISGLVVSGIEVIGSKVRIKSLAI
jgi:prephenate dehydrogenase